MKHALIIIVVIALALSWLWFWTVLSRPGAQVGEEDFLGGSDTVTVWVNELIGSPDEAYYYELADLWNRTHPRVKMKISVMSHAGYQSKLRVAIATGQPPDVCMGGLATLESLQYTGKATDLSVPIPDEYLSQATLHDMGPVVERSIVRDGHATVFPIYKYAYGGVLLANRTMLTAAGFDDEAIRNGGWTLNQFRDACRRMTRDTDGDGSIEIWGFGAALVHLQHLFLDEFGPGIWGRDVSLRHFLVQDPSTGAWRLHPDLTEERVYEVLNVFDQLVNVDKSWNPATLGMNWNEINDELVIRRRLGMTFGETPWVAKLRRDIWEADRAAGAIPDGEPPDLTMVWMPTLRAGDWPAPRAGVMGFSVLKQDPYKGDAHTENALRVGLFLTHPTHLARSQLRQFRHLPPDTRKFAEIFPELVHLDDPWVQFYNEVMDSDIPVVEEPLSPSDPHTAQYIVLRTAIDLWLEKEGTGYIEQVIYRRLTPREAARQFMEGLRAAANSAEEIK